MISFRSVEDLQEMAITSLHMVLYFKIARWGIIGLASVSLLIYLLCSKENLFKAIPLRMKLILIGFAISTPTIFIYLAVNLGDRQERWAYREFFIQTVWLIL